MTATTGEARVATTTRSSGAVVRSVLTLVTGSFAAQAVAILSSPLLTRMYSSADLGESATFAAVASSVAVVATGRYELAVMVPPRDAEACAIVRLALALAAATSLVACGAVVAIALVPGGWPHPRAWWYLVPVAIFLGSVFQTLSYVANRAGDYAVLSGARLTLSIATTAAMLALGATIGGPWGAVLGAIIGQVAAVAVLACGSAVRWFRRMAASDDDARETLGAIARRHHDFPRFLIPAHGLNALAGRLPVFILGACFGPSVVGCYSLADRTVRIPITVVGSAIGDVFRQHASERFSRLGECRAVFLRTIAILAALAVPTFACVAWLAPSLFAAVFGASWEPSGRYVRLLSLMFAVQFVSSPVSSMYFIAGRQRGDLALQCVITVVAIATLGYGSRALGSDAAAVALYGLGYAAIYATNLVITYRLARGRA